MSVDMFCWMEYGRGGRMHMTITTLLSSSYVCESKKHFSYSVLLMMRNSSQEHNDRPKSWLSTGDRCRFKRNMSTRAEYQNSTDSTLLCCDKEWTRTTIKWLFNGDYMCFTGNHCSLIWKKNLVWTTKIAHVFHNYSWVIDIEQNFNVLDALQEHWIKVCRS